MLQAGLETGAPPRIGDCARAEEPACRAIGGYIPDQTMAIKLAVPVLRVTDVARSMEWYRGTLAFVGDPFPTTPPFEFAILRQGQVELMLSALCHDDIYKGACLLALTRALKDPDDGVRRQVCTTLYNLALHNLAPWTFTNSPAKQAGRLVCGKAGNG